MERWRRKGESDGLGKKWKQQKDVGRSGRQRQMRGTESDSEKHLEEVEAGVSNEWGCEGQQHEFTSY